MRRRFFTLDVFTTRRFAGNPLGVVLEPEGLDDAAMQAIAREFNLPETVFVFPPVELKHRAKLRIFTPARELPFAGHPTVGAAVLLAHLDGGAGERELVLGETVGPVACRVTPQGEGGSASFAIPRLPERVGALADTGAVALALGLATADVGFDGFAPDAWTAGNAFAFVPLGSLDALGRARPDIAHWEKAFGGLTGAFLFCASEGAPFRARMFAPASGVPEDPATGSAAAAFAGLLAASGRYGDGEHRVAIGQGFEMGRPSTIRLGMVMRGGKLAAATVGGEAVIVSEGTIEA